jgi:hypothetical protein
MRFAKQTLQRGPSLKPWILALFVALLPTLALTSEPDPEFDRLDGKGKSRRRVDVIEWEGNLEVHVYPGGALRGLALKLDDRDQARKVMVLGYRFDTQPQKQLIRRALLSIPMRPGFRVYRDPSSGEEYDKIIISQHQLGKPLLAYQTEAEPKQLYPEGHPLNPEESEKSRVAARPLEPMNLGQSPGGQQESVGAAAMRTPASGTHTPGESAPPKTILPSQAPEESDGSIRPFQW